MPITWIFTDWFVIMKALLCWHASSKINLNGKFQENIEKCISYTHWIDRAIKYTELKKHHSHNWTHYTTFSCHFWININIRHVIATNIETNNAIVAPLAVARGVESVWEEFAKISLQAKEKGNLNAARTEYVPLEIVYGDRKVHKEHRRKMSSKLK